MNFADELAEIAANVAGLRVQLDRLSSRIINSTAQDTVHKMRIEQGKLMGECLSLRLAILYKIEEHWPEVLTALRAVDSSAASK